MLHRIGLSSLRIVRPPHTSQVSACLGGLALILVGRAALEADTAAAPTALGASSGTSSESAQSIPLRSYPAPPPAGWRAQEPVEG